MSAIEAASVKVTTTVIEASSVRVQTMADNTLRLTVDIEPRFANDAFQLFGKSGQPMALAALKPTKLDDKPDDFERGRQQGMKQEHALWQLTAEGQRIEADKPKGGVLSQDAARICQTAEFQAFAMSRGFVTAASGEEAAADFVRSYCGIKSRAELDHDPRAARLFSALMTQYREAA